MTTKSPIFAAWMDDFFASYYRYRPVNATFIGEHEHDHRLPDFSENGVADCLSEMTDLLNRLRSLPPEPLAPEEWIDRTLAEGFLRIQDWEYRSSHFHRGNPSLYTGEAVFSVIGLHLNLSSLPFKTRAAAAIERMQAIPGFLATAKANLREAPRAWTERAIRECQGALALFGDGIDRLIADEHLSRRDLRAAADIAAGAFADFQDYLRDYLLANANEAYTCGEAAFDLMMRQGHFFDLDGNEIVVYAERAWTEADAYLAENAGRFDAASPAEALAGLADLHPTAAGYYARYTEVWDACRETAIANNLVTWPDFPIEYVPRPAWSRGAAPYLYFLFYRSPAAFKRPEVLQYLVAPLDTTQSSAEIEAFLRGNNDTVIKTNHVVHHGSIGHHVQNWHSARATSRIGRVAAVDCASRVAMFCSGTMAEGWACYATNLMGEVGFLTSLEMYAEQQSRRRMSARAMVDVKLHHGQFTLDEAAAFYQQRAGMSPAAAHGEAVKNSMFPGAAMMYLLGADKIADLRNKLAAQQGEGFSLAGFHDRFLSFGSIPVSLISAAMLREAHDAE